jgi:succinyl-CoA synthetase beta subunit
VNLHEYQAKRLFARFGVPIPKGDVATTPEQARVIAEELGGQVVVKSQVLTGGRGKAGGIKLARNPNEAEEYAGQILGLEIRGFKVRKVLIDEAADIRNEIYLAILIDRAGRQPMLMASAAGGMDIEQVAAETPEKILTVNIDPMIGIRSYQTTYVALKMGLAKELWSEFFAIASGLYQAFEATDASLAEINPLVITGEGHLLAVDGKMSIDDNALFRQSQLAEVRDVDEETLSEREAREHGLSYIQLDGNIGCMVNGAGLAMATMILFNVFGGIVRGDEVARGIIQSLDEVGTEVPMVIRLLGTNAEQGMKILSEANMETAMTLTEAAQKAVASAQKRQV